MTTRRKEGCPYVVLLLVNLVRDCVFGSGETGGGVGVGVAFGDLCGFMSAARRLERSGGEGEEGSVTFVALLGGSRHSALDRLGGLIDGVPGWTMGSATRV